MFDRRSHRTAGFTLVELLMAIAIVGILLTAVVSMTGATLRFSSSASSVNELVSQANDAAGYLATNARRAVRGIGCQDRAGSGTADDPAESCAQESSVRITSGGSAFDCNTTSPDGPCLALIVPVVDRSVVRTPIVGYELLAYRVLPVSAWVGDPGLPEGWAGDDTLVMVEYRAPLACGNPCTAPAPPTSVTANRESLVLSDLLLEDVNGVPIAPFAVHTDRNSVQLDLLSTTFRFRMRVPNGGKTYEVPSDHTLVVTATSRP